MLGGRPWLSLLVCLCVLAATIELTLVAGQAPPPSAISRADAVADLDALFDAIERIHPAPYHNRSRELVMADRRQLVAALPDTLTRREWWVRLAPIVASLGDGHTEVPPSFTPNDWLAAASSTGAPPADPRQVFQAIRWFPDGSLTVDNGHLIVRTSDLADGVGRGDRVISINGQDADRLLSDWIRATSGDTDPNRAITVTDRLTDLLFAHSIVAPYRLTVADADGGERTGSTGGLTVQAWMAAIRPSAPFFSYRVLEPGIGYMDFHSMGGDFGRFKKALAAMFRSMAAAQVRTLIVDLRKNTGGYVQFGEQLLRYFTHTPYRTSSREEIKRSQELREQGAIPPPFRWLPVKYLIPYARRVYGKTGTVATWAPSTKTPSAANPFFTGPVCVLTGARTFSAAVSLADAVNTYRLATIVGEETGGRANMTGEPLLYILPRSRFAASIAAGRSTRANGDATDSRGVIPDIVVKPTADDIRAGRDPVIDRARDCPRIQ